MTLPAATAETTIPDAASRRWRAVSAPHGIAALRHTHWLDGEAREYEDAPGTWRAANGRVVGTGIRDDAGVEIGEVVLAPGQHADVGRLRLKAIERGGALALRVFDPETPGRTRLRGILSFPRSEEWVLTGVFRPAADGEINVVESVDGHEREEAAVGTVELEIAGEPVSLSVTTGLGPGLGAVIADATGNVDAYRFRFLPVSDPDADGIVIVDFNRAYLPPCAFSDHYVCPLPPASNRLTVRVEAGERIADIA